MKNKKSDPVVEDIGDRIKQESFDHLEETKRKKPNWLKWFLNIIDTIVTALT
jgi:hypothetical protein